MNTYLKKYIPIVDFLAAMLGNDAEIVLHDVSDIEKSVVAIRNNHISGREVGSPATNLLLKVLNDGKYNNVNYLVNYKGISATGKALKSSTFFIRDDQQQLVGMLCVNIDCKNLYQLKKYLDNVLQIPQKAEENNTIERFSNSVEGLAFDSIQTIIENAGIPPERMTQNEKIEVIKKMNDEGVFLLKGNVSRVANMLKVSEATIYRYLNNIKKEY